MEKLGQVINKGDEQITFDFSIHGTKGFFYMKIDDQYIDFNSCGERFSSTEQRKLLGTECKPYHSTQIGMIEVPSYTFEIMQDGRPLYVAFDDKRVDFDSCKVSYNERTGFAYQVDCYTESKMDFNIGINVLFSVVILSLVTVISFRFKFHKKLESLFSKAP